MTRTKRVASTKRVELLQQLNAQCLNKGHWIINDHIVTKRSSKWVVTYKGEEVELHVFMDALHLIASRNHFK